MEQIIAKLAKIKEQGLYRELKYLSGPQGPRTFLEGKEVILMASNNYLGLCNDQRLKNAAISAIQKYGVGSGGSRLTTGSYDIQRELEERLAQFKGTEASMVFNTGYMANLGTITALTNKDWTIFSDELNHASIIDGCRLSGAKVVVYKHSNTQDLYEKMQGHQGKNTLIITDGVFSMDGDIAPLPEIVKIAEEFNSLVMVDDAHATGVIGKNGAGTAEHFGLKDKIQIQMGTLSKALAGEGGYIAGSHQLIAYLRNSARSFIFSTALAPATMAVALKAIEIVEQEPEMRMELLHKAKWFKEELMALDFNLWDSQTPIIPIIIGDATKAVSFSQNLLEEGIYVTAIRPPTVPQGTSRLRVTLMATHTQEDLEVALEKIKKVGRRLQII